MSPPPPSPDSSSALERARWFLHEVQPHDRAAAEPDRVRALRTRLEAVAAADRDAVRP